MQSTKNTIQTGRGENKGRARASRHTDNAVTAALQRVSHTALALVIGTKKAIMQCGEVFAWRAADAGRRGTDEHSWAGATQ